MPTIKVGRKSRKVNGTTYYVDNFYFNKSSALNQAKKLRNRGFLAQVRVEGKNRQGRTIYVVLKRHKKHPRLHGLLG